MELICGKGYPLEIITLETIYKFSHTHTHTHTCSLFGNAYVLLADYYYFFRKDCSQMKAK